MAVVGAMLLFAPLIRAQKETPEHPIDTHPEGPGKTCSYTVTDSSGDKVTGSSNCAVGAPADTPASKRFPFPGEAGAMDAPKTAPQAAPKTAPQAPPAGDSASRKFPFPGESTPEPNAAGGAGKAAGLQDAGSSGESSSSSGNDAGESSSSSANALPPSPDDVNSDTPPAPKRTVKRRPEAPPKSVADQEAEDLQVAGFYMNDKNYRGAYGRAQDAVTLAGDDADAHLALAEAARHLGKLDEAEKEYRRALQLDPVPKTKKAAERALKEMTGGA